MIIKSEIELGSKLPSFPQDIIKNESMFFNSTWNYAYEHGGEPTKQFLLALPSELHKKSTIIDSRVHMLMPGWYPCIPGFHHDDVPRDRADGQPEYNEPSYRSNHALALYNGDICPTEFALGTGLFTEPTLHSIIYKEWHKEVVKHLEKNLLTLTKAPSEQIVFFNDRTFHQGNTAVKSGWRLFLRASWNTNRKPSNEIRRQVQVYLEHPMQGW